MFGELGEKMRRKLNQKGGVVAGILIGAGVITAVGSLIVRGNNSVVLDLLRQIAIWLDSALFWIATGMYSIFYELSSSSVLSTLNLATASQRLYSLLGIFMLFRLAFSFIKYIVNPDDMEKGTSKFISNLAVSLALIVSVPWIFNRAFALQNYIMESNVIGNLILGMNNDRSTEDTFNAGTYGQSIAFLTFSAFYRPNSAISGLEPCANILVYYDDYVVPEGDKKVKVVSSGSDERDKQNTKIAACVNALNGTDSTYSLVFSGSEQSTTELGTMFYIASKRQDMSLLTDPDVWKAKYSDRYVIDYVAIVSTIALGFLALLFMSFSFDVAIRNVKLCFLQIIAPIPIILNIEPGDTKGDKKSLGWWTKECLKTYVDLFVRVATVYFGVFLINILFTGNSVVGSNNSSPWFKVFMIFGILLFVKQIPEMIGKAFGIDVKGQFNLNPLKRIGDNRLASMALGGAAGLVSGLGTGIAAYRGARGAQAGVGESLRRALTGGLGGAVHSGFTGATKGVKGFKDIVGNARDNWSRSGRVAGANVGTTYGERLAAKAAMIAGAPTKSDRIASEAKAMEDIGNTFGNMKSFSLGSKEDMGIARTLSGAVKVSSATGYQAYKDELNANIAKAIKAGDATKEAAYRAKLTNLESHRSDILSGIAYTDGTISATDQLFGNVKDANDYLERLKASGASVADIQAAEDLTSNFVNNYIDAYRGNSTHAIGAMWENAMREYDQYAGVMAQYGIGKATDAVSLKGNTTSAKSGASAHKLSQEAKAADRAKAAASASGPGGRR